MADLRMPMGQPLAPPQQPQSVAPQVSHAEYVEPEAAPEKEATPVESTPVEAQPEPEVFEELEAPIEAEPETEEPAEIEVKAE